LKYKNRKIFLFVIILLSIVFIYNSANAKITGNCANCHTMHASQNGTSGGIALGGSSLPQPALLRGDCMGCHGQGTPNKIVTIGGSQIPQVLHTDPSGDLAGGNFAYITGAGGKPRVTADQNSAGHNVIDLGSAYKETVLTYAPGYLIDMHDYVLYSSKLTCAGYIGCHGNRYDDTHQTTGIPMIKGAHHQNVDGKCDTADQVYNSYRFLLGVKGLENTTDKWQNKDQNSHNEYYGVTAPMNVDQSGGDCSNCHNVSGVQPSNHTISGFCATCHGQFHAQASVGYGSSAFIRHPTDIILPNSGEYLAYTTYSVEAPVARQTVFDSISPTVQPGADVVMCLSCHAAHATPYADMLRWNYNGMVAGGGGSGGCFTCHTQKNQTP
jgi:hypothetical protein